MGIVLGTRGRQMIEVSLADDLPAVVAAWCAKHELSAEAGQKVQASLQTRLDEALAKAFAEAAENEAGMC